MRTGPVRGQIQHWPSAYSSNEIPRTGQREKESTDCRPVRESKQESLLASKKAFEAKYGTAKIPKKAKRTQPSRAAKGNGWDY